MPDRTAVGIDGEILKWN